MNRTGARPAHRICIAGLLALAVTLDASAAPPPADPDKPFAEARILLQLSDADEQVQARVLSVANNLVKHYGGPDLVDIEIVAFGPGVSLLYAGNAQAERVSSLAANGVRFVACDNTLDTLERVHGERPVLQEGVFTVKTGVAHIVARMSDGFAVVRP